MTKTISSLLPAPEGILSMKLEDLSMVLLRYFSENEDALNRHNFGQKDTVREYPKEYHVRILRAFMEGWAWLERELLIARRPTIETSMEFYFITRRGMRVLAGGSE